MGLDAAKLTSILAADAKQKADKRTGPRNPKDPTEPRDYATWFKLNHSFGKCSNPGCVDPREGNGPDGTAMVADIHGVDSCRFCFLSGYGRPAESS